MSVCLQRKKERGRQRERERRLPSPKPYFGSLPLRLLSMAEQVTNICHVEAGKIV